MHRTVVSLLAATALVLVAAGCAGGAATGSGVIGTSAVLQGEWRSTKANVQVLVWFEYGPDTNYGHTLISQSQCGGFLAFPGHYASQCNSGAANSSHQYSASNQNAYPLSSRVPFAPGTYHFRLCAKEVEGQADKICIGDKTFTIPS